MKTRGPGTEYTVADNDRRSARHRRTWDAPTKAKIVRQGLHGKPVAALCNAYQLSHSLSYHWRDQLLAQAGQVFEGHPHDQTAAHLMREHARVNARVGEL
jgi:transposase-like protein